MINLDFVGVDIFVWMLRNARKCEKHDKIGFFGVFSRIQPNTRKYFEMQPNTKIYFPFLKIAFPENIYFPENILHEPNTT